MFIKFIKAFFYKSVDSILKDVLVKVGHLEEAVARHRAEAEVQRKVAADAMQEAEVHASEAIRASRVSAKLRDLVA